MAYDKVNHCKGLIYISVYNIENLDMLVEELEEQGVVVSTPPPVRLGRAAPSRSIEPYPSTANQREMRQPLIVSSYLFTRYLNHVPISLELRIITYFMVITQLSNRTIYKK